MSSNIDYLDTTSTQFTPPESEHSLRQHSEKLVFSTRLFPEWLAACYGVLRKKYPSITISSSSELIQLIVQEFINQNIDVIGGHLPPTQDSVNFLLSAGFINPDSKTQFTKLSKANHKSEKYEEQMMSSNNPRDQYMYWKDRDPEKAEAILEQMTNDAVEHIFSEEQPDEEKPGQVEDNSPVSKPQSFDSLLSKRDSAVDGIAGLDNMPTPAVSESSDEKQDD